MVRISDIHNNEVDWEHVPFCGINETDILTRNTLFRVISRIFHVTALNILILLNFYLINNTFHDPAAAFLPPLFFAVIYCFPLFFFSPVLRRRWDGNTAKNTYSRLSTLHFSEIP